MNVVVEKAEGRGCQERSERALNGACRDEHPEALRRSADGGGDREPGEPADEGPLASEEVGDPPAEQEQAAERQRVGGHHPLAVVNREVQGALCGRQRDVHDGRVEHDHQLGDADDQQDRPTVLVVRVLVCGHSRLQVDEWYPVEKTLP